MNVRNFLGDISWFCLFAKTDMDDKKPLVGHIMVSKKTFLNGREINKTKHFELEPLGNTYHTNEYQLGSGY
jgi:hypothetical protein